MTTVPSRRLILAACVLTAAAVVGFVLPGVGYILLAANGVLVLAAIVDWIASPRSSLIDVQRFVAPRPPVLAQCLVELAVRNKSPITLSVRVRDTPPLAMRTTTEEVVGVVPANGSTRLTYETQPTSRGKHSFGAIHLRYRSLMGLWEMGRVIDAPAEVRVYPNRSAWNQYQLLAKANRLESLGIRVAKQRGASMEFDTLQDYTAGDDVRLLDWKATARRSKLTVRRQRVERNQTILLLIDSGRLMTAEEDGVAKLDHAVNAALLLAHVALSRGDRVGLLSFSSKVHGWLPPRGNIGQNRLIAESLYDLKGDVSETDHGRALRFIAARHPKRSLLVVLTDFVDATTAADMITHLDLVGRTHLILFAALKDIFLERASQAAVENVTQAHVKAAAVDLLRERQEVLTRLRKRGLLVVDAAPTELAPPLLNRYLEVVQRGMV